ncbi:MAG: hypothetical protein S4CHLAM37_03110 [Chlamydiia bacterium]|nr:hypothetical protein [Chlamydiia bacterium]
MKLSKYLGIFFATLVAIINDKGDWQLWQYRRFNVKPNKKWKHQNIIGVDFVINF